METCMAIDADTAALLDHGAACVRVDRHGKRPLGMAWHTLASAAADVIGSWLDSGWNVGLLLGHGNLIDIEYDDAAGAKAFHAMRTADGTPLHEIETPCWASSRGTHHLFRLADPIPSAGWVKRGGLEIRLGGKPAQSVLPPSIHPTGTPYAWLVSPQQCAPAVITLRDLGLEG